MRRSTSGKASDRGNTSRARSCTEGLNLDPVADQLLNNIQESFGNLNLFENNLKTLAQYLKKYNKFNYYVLIKGKTPGVYKKWDEILFEIRDFRKPLYKGFYLIEEAIQFAQQQLGDSFFLSPYLSPDLQEPSGEIMKTTLAPLAGGRQLVPPLGINQYLIEGSPSTSTSIPLVEDTQRQLRMYFNPRVPLPELPDDSRQLIFQKAEASGHAKLKAIQQFLQQIAEDGTNRSGIGFTWDTYYSTTEGRLKRCNRCEGETADGIPLDRYDCQCQLVYSICRVCLDLSSYEPIQFLYEGEIIELTPQLLLDYGFLYQLIFTKMADTELVGRKFAIAVLESMPPNYIEALIQSKAPEWKGRHLLPAQHKIILRRRSSLPRLYRDVQAWPSTTQSLTKQLRHWRARMMAHMQVMGDDFTAGYTFFTEDSIQKIYLDPDVFIHSQSQREISFSPQTSYTQLLDIYSEEYKNGEDQYEYAGAGVDLGDDLPNDDPDEPEIGMGFYDDLDSVGWENLENQMEG
ncbi:hypothetical protein SLA2020_043140 [Shorea laevis]